MPWIRNWASEFLPLLQKVEKSVRCQKVNDILKEVGLAEKACSRPDELSGGQQQQVAVARAIIARPRVVLADEPTGSLHWSQGQRIMGLLKSLNEAGTTIVQVTHDDRVAAYGQRIVELNDGWIK